MAMNVMGTVLVAEDLIDEMGGLVSDAVHVQLTKHGDGTVSLVVTRCEACAEQCKHVVRVVRGTHP